jgi:phosphonate transport system substrate-binding protein
MRLPALLLALLLSVSTALRPAAARELVLLSISPYPTQEIEVFQPFAAYLASQLATDGITAGKVVVVPDIASGAAALRAGHADIYIGSPYPVMAIGELAGARPLLRRWKEGKVEYHTVFVTRAGSPLKSLQALPGRRIAFETAFSTTAYFLPKSELERLGLRLRELARPDEQPRSGEVGYVFAGDRENTAAWLLRDRVEAAALGVHDWEALKPREREQMQVIHATAPVPRQVVSVRANLEPELAASISTALKRMNETDDGRRALAAFERTTRFDDLPPEALKALDGMRPLVRRTLDTPRKR